MESCGFGLYWSNVCFRSFPAWTLAAAAFHLLLHWLCRPPDHYHHHLPEPAHHLTLQPIITRVQLPNSRPLSHPLPVFPRLLRRRSLELCRGLLGAHYTSRPAGLRVGDSHITGRSPGHRLHLPQASTASAGESSACCRLVRLWECISLSSLWGKHFYFHTQPATFDFFSHRRSQSRAFIQRRWRVIWPQQQTSSLLHSRGVILASKNVLFLVCMIINKLDLSAFLFLFFFFFLRPLRARYVMTCHLITSMTEGLQDTE